MGVRPSRSCTREAAQGGADGLTRRPTQHPVRAHSGEQHRGGQRPARQPHSGAGGLQEGPARAPHLDAGVCARLQQLLHLAVVILRAGHEQQQVDGRGAGCRGRGTGVPRRSDGLWSRGAQAAAVAAAAPGGSASHLQAQWWAGLAAPAGMRLPPPRQLTCKHGLAALVVALQGRAPARACGAAGGQHRPTRCALLSGPLHPTPGRHPQLAARRRPRSSHPASHPASRPASQSRRLPPTRPPTHLAGQHAHVHEVVLHVAGLIVAPLLALEVLCARPGVEAGGRRWRGWATAQRLACNVRHAVPCRDIEAAQGRRAFIVGC